MNIEIVDPDHVSLAWPHLKRFIELSQRRGPTDMTCEQMRYYCQADPNWRLVLLGDLDGAAIICAQGDSLHVAAIGGRLPKGWHVEMFEWLSRGAKANGLGYITLAGRKGWARKLRDLGFVQLDGLYLGAEVT